MLMFPGSTGHSAQQDTTRGSYYKLAFPQERRELYDNVSRDAVSTKAKNAVGVIPNDLHQSSKGRLTRDSAAMSFVVLSESQVVPPPSPKVDDRSSSQSSRSESKIFEGPEDDNNAMSRHAQTATRLFEILTARSDIDHPICTECTDLLVEGLQKRLEVATKERDAYIGFLKQAKADVPTEEEVQESQEALKRAGEEEAAAIEQLESLEKEKAAVDAEIAQLEEEARQLDIEEEAFWRSRNAFAEKLTEFQEERDSVNLKFDHDSQQLQKLHRTNVYNDTFCISHDGTFGTINGLRLGRLSNVPVDWPEINAAWGHTLFLLMTVADKLSFKFAGFRLKPMGSTSRIEKLDYPAPSASQPGPLAKKPEPKVTVLDLYSSGDLPLGLTFMHRKFDNAMVAFLDCLRQLGDFVEFQSSETGQVRKLPYEIKKDKIGDISIKLGVAQDDAWSKACKYTLTCCKFLLAHASNVNGSSRRPGA